MFLGLRLLESVADVNRWSTTAVITAVTGDPQEVYVQLVDRNRLTGCVEGQAAARYMPAVGASMELTFESLDAAKRVVKTAVQPFALDPSIWQVTLTPTESLKLMGTVSLSFALTEGTRVARGRVPAALLIKG